MLIAYRSTTDKNDYDTLYDTGERWALPWNSKNHYFGVSVHEFDRACPGISLSLSPEEKRQWAALAKNI